jgi:hypothetical protein
LSTISAAASPSSTQAVNAKAAPRRKDAAYLGERACGLGEMEDAEVHRHDIERPVREREPLRVADNELEVGETSARQLDHRLGDVDTDRLGAARPSCFGDVARPTRDVEQPRARPYVGCVQQRLAKRRVSAQHSS